MFKRYLPIHKLIENNSVFLLGPRLTGKSTFINQEFPNAISFDLLQPSLYRQLIKDITFFQRVIDDKIAQNGDDHVLVIVDEIQLIPELLNIIHSEIFKYPNIRFILTGSSARKLRSKGVNLLGGRAGKLVFNPISINEVTTFNNLTWKNILIHGGLPSVLLSTNPWQQLDNYVGLYLREEIAAEGLTRDLTGFSNFLQLAGNSNGKEIVYDNIAKDCGIKVTTLKNYFEILQDTLIGNLILPFKKTYKRKSVSSSKFYLFDVGVANFLAGHRFLEEGTDLFGRAFEHLFYVNLKTAIDYFAGNNKPNIYYWRSINGYEVDFILEYPNNKYIGIEVKGRATVDKHDTTALQLLNEEVPLYKKFIIKTEGVSELYENGVRVVSLNDFFFEKEFLLMELVV